MGSHEVLERLLRLECFTAERTTDGMRIMLRGRRVHRSQYAGDALPIVMTIEHRFEKIRDDGLPSSKQHAAYGEWIFPVIDAIRDARVGIHVFADTTDGLVREWFYVSDIKVAAKLIKQHAAEGFGYELMYDDDPEWAFLDALMSGIRIEDDPNW